MTNGMVLQDSGLITTPQGKRPTLMDFSEFRETFQNLIRYLEIHGKVKFSVFSEKGRQVSAEMTPPPLMGHRALQNTAQVMAATIEGAGEVEAKVDAAGAADGPR